MFVSFCQMSGMELLFALGALDTNGSLTEPLGLHMAELPLAPLLAKMVLGAAEFSCTEEALSIAAMLQVENVFIRPARGDQKVNAERCRRKFSVLEGDHITLLNVYAAFIKFGRSSQWCRQNFVHYKGMCRAVEIRKQLQQFLVKLKLPSGNSKSTILMFLSFHPAYSLKHIDHSSSWKNQSINQPNNGIFHVFNTHERYHRSVDWLIDWFFQKECPNDRVDFSSVFAAVLGHGGGENLIFFTGILSIVECIALLSPRKRSRTLKFLQIFPWHVAFPGPADVFRENPAQSKIFFSTFENKKNGKNWNSSRLTQSKIVWKLVKFFFQIFFLLHPVALEGLCAIWHAVESPLWDFFLCSNLR